MFSKIKNYIIYIFIALTLTMGGLYWYENIRRQKAESELVLEVNNRKAAERGVQIWRDEAGKAHATSIEYMYTLNEFKHSADSVNKRLLNHLKNSDVKMKNVERLLEVSNRGHTILTDSILIPHMPDTIITLTDPWTINKIHLSPRNISSEILTTDTLTGVFTSHKETVKPPKKFFLCRWFQKKHTIVEVDIMNANPNVEITNQKLIKIID